MGNLCQANSSLSEGQPQLQPKMDISKTLLRSKDLDDEDWDYHTSQNCSMDLSLMLPER